MLMLVVIVLGHDKCVSSSVPPAGSVTGVGVEVTHDDSQGSKSELVVVTPAAGGPADSAGVKAGDIIAAIDGKPTSGMSLYEASDLLQGDPDSQVRVVVGRGQLCCVDIHVSS